MEQNMRNVHAKVKERLKVVLSDVNGLSKHLEQHISKCEEGKKEYSHKSFQYAVVIRCCLTVSRSDLNGR